MNSYSARFARRGTIATGDTAYYETRVGYRTRIKAAPVTRATETQVTLDLNGTPYVFRLQPSTGRFTNKDRYEEMDLVTKDAFDQDTAQQAAEKATNTARNLAMGAVNTLSNRQRWMSSADLEAAISVLQEQAAALKDLGL